MLASTSSSISLANAVILVPYVFPCRESFSLMTFCMSSIEIKLGKGDSLGAKNNNFERVETRRYTVLMISWLSRWPRLQYMCYHQTLTYFSFSFVFQSVSHSTDNFDFPIFVISRRLICALSLHAIFGSNAREIECQRRGSLSHTGITGK